eukprot:scaffold3576_cov69-Phaeocystis_antarctica.AAC.2
MWKAHAVVSAQSSEPTGRRSLASRNRCAASTLCPELASDAPRLKYAWGSSGLSAMASRQALAALRQSSFEAYRAPSASNSSYSSPVCAASRASSSAALRARCCATPPSSVLFRNPFTSLWYTVCRFQAAGFPGQLTQHQYVVGTFSLTQIGQTSCFTRLSPISDGSLAQPKQARLTATPEGTPPSSAVAGTTAAGGAAAASVASLSAFSASSASRTSLLPAPRPGCCSRSLASSGLGPSSGSASHSPRTASRRASDIGACLLQRLHARGSYATAPGSSLGSKDGATPQ